MGAFNNAIAVGEIITVSDSITRPANTTQYSANDAVSDVTANAHYSFKWTDSQIKAPFSGLIKTAILMDSTTTATPPDLELWLFHTDITAIADADAFTITDAELLTCIGVIDFATGSFQSSALNSLCMARDINLPFTAPGSTIYGQLVVRNTYTPPSNSEVITTKLIIAKDVG